MQESAMDEGGNVAGVGRRAEKVLRGEDRLRRFFAVVLCIFPNGEYSVLRCPGGHNTPRLGRLTYLPRGVSRSKRGSSDFASSLTLRCE